MSKKVKVIIIGGPTGIGKTSLSLWLADMIDGQLINADSRQIYIGADIGTNKGVIEKSYKSFKYDNTKLDGFYLENTNIIGWLFNIINPDEYFSVADFQNLAKLTVEKVSHTGIPIIVGGTGLYIDSLLKGYDIPNDKPNLEYRKLLNNKSLQELQNLVKNSSDKFEKLNNSDKNNPRRLMRILEKIKNKDSNKKDINKTDYNKIIIEPYFIYPKYTVEQLSENITTRVIRMIEDGLITEVRELVVKGYENTEFMKGMGYKEVLSYLHGGILDEQELIEKISTAHLQYAKRQRTWFEGEGRKYDLHIFDFDNDKELILNKLEEFFE